jgi:hypothetical protein
MVKPFTKKNMHARHTNWVSDAWLREQVEPNGNGGWYEYIATLLRDGMGERPLVDASGTGGMWWREEAVHYALRMSPTTLELGE